MARVAMTGTAAADPVADGAGAQAPATVVLPGMRSGPWNRSDRAQLEDAVGVARLFGASCVRLIRPGYATIEVDLKHEKAAGDRESVKVAERSYIERTAPKKKELTDEQLAARTASRKAKKIRQKERRAKEAGERAANEAENAERPRAQLRENIEYVMAGLRSAAAQARSQAGSNIGVEYSLPPERDDGYRCGPSKVYATVPQGTVATTVAPDWLANELAGRGKIDAACRDRMVMHLMTAAGASAPADAVFRFTAGEAMQTEDDDEDADRSEEYSDDDGRASDL
ncbi:hypothetical protein EMIHUDRAFT_208438 [Emiliania huxleyi CCMP1516]|uniref:PE-PGRS family protein n=2 Tax=Emiliania huxleyi TaxID=2903 RepID=A0A0D3JAJ9_EMIH1|nr:hypothetical protein EMIHUDRAFT_208438 [Emiliania huxleyi CCMP1516]EOD20534.1 hypothetical protein EMIHUDRAFT_208438 [Emiliania huxleyi CCMP1516]|eukprot:XP_005772963.1 hypothetical protein EMIHUDRAFT_208438 [Emiliania huxleyi CCMP1516]